MDKEAHTHRLTPPSLKHLSPTLSVFPRFLAHISKNTHIYTLSPVSRSLFFYYFKSLNLSLSPALPSVFFFYFFYPKFLKVVCPSHLLSHSQGVSTLSVLCVPSLSVLCNRSYFHPCLSVTVAAGWLNIYIFHSLVTFPCCRSGSSSLLAALLLTDYCLQISYGHSKWYTGSQGQRVQRLEKGRKRERGKGRMREQERLLYPGQTVGRLIEN